MPDRTNYDAQYFIELLTERLEDAKRGDTNVRLTWGDAEDLIALLKEGTTDTYPSPWPADAVAWKWADPTEGAKWIFDDVVAERIAREDPNLIVWRKPHAAQEAAANDLQTHQRGTGVG